MLDGRLDQPAAALEVLIGELEIGESQTASWEKLHTVAGRDGLEQQIGDAYNRAASSQRMKRLAARAQAEFFMHAADYFQGIRGDNATSESYLEKTLRAVPGHAEAFMRLEPRIDSAYDPRRAAELYAGAAQNPPIPSTTLATKAMHKILLLTADTPLSDDACRALVVLVPANTRLVRVLESHCRQTNRAALACAIMEDAILDPDLPEEALQELRYRIIELYLGEAATPASAIPHVEELLKRDPADAVAKKAAEKLLGTRAVASRAAGVLQTARRQSMPPPPGGASPSTPPPRSVPPSTSGSNAPPPVPPPRSQPPTRGDS
jgi:hypothetical protein